MKTVNVVVRPCDLDAIRVIREYLERHGLLVGKRTVSQCVRYALEHTAEAIQEYNAVATQDAPPPGGR